MANNVTLHQKNKDGAYDNLYPRTTADHTMLTSATGNKYGLTDGNAEQAVSISMQFIQTIGVISIYVFDPLNNPVEGAVIQGVSGSPSTNASGFVQGTLVANPIIVKSPYVDLKDKSVDVSGYVGTTRALNVTLDSVSENKIVRYTSSTSVKFSPATKTIDVCCVGAGGGGTPTIVYQTSVGGYSGWQGAGGGAGAIVNYYGVAVDPLTLYSIAIGQGASASTAVGANPTVGGSSSFDNLSAIGGNSSSYILHDTGVGYMPIAGTAGLEGCGNGGDIGRAGSVGDGTSNTSISEFDDGRTFYGGGGAAGGYNGGSPNGARGGYTYGVNIYDAAAAGIGGGGGGGYWRSANVGYQQSNPSSGGSGLVAIRIHLS